jgi:hypothetical protein
MVKLIFEDVDNFESTVEAIKDLIDEAAGLNELIDIEDEFIGLCAYLDWDDGWEELRVFLDHLKSPYARIIEALNDRWEELENEQSK